MIQNNILELNKIVYLVYIHILKFIDQKKEVNKIIVILIQIKEQDLVEKMVKDLEFGLIKIFKILIVHRLMILMKMDHLYNHM